MSALLPSLEIGFGWLLDASWQASVLALAVIAVQRIFGASLNPRWRYALWLLVVLRLVLPVLPESALSLFQFAPPPPAALTVSVTEPLFIAAPDFPPVDVAAAPPRPEHPLSFYSLLAITWLAGALGLSVLTLFVNLRFARQVANSREITDPELLRLFAEAKREFHVRRPIRLIENSQVQSPAIMGLFAPTLLLPADVRTRFDGRELRFIFLHELAHLKRGDVLIQALIALLQILHWFNPVLWFAFRRMRIDREPATDALVLSRTGEDEKERYGLMLIKLLEHFNQRHSLATLVGILEDKDQFKRRFGLIARFSRGSYGRSLLGVLLIGALAIAGLTKSKVQNLDLVPKPGRTGQQAALPTGNEGVNANPKNAGSVPLETPQQLYLDVYLALGKRPDQMEKDGKFAEALANYQDQITKLQAIQKSFPNWEAVLVATHIRSCQVKIDEVKAKMAGDSTAPTKAAVSAFVEQDKAAPAAEPDAASAPADQIEMRCKVGEVREDVYEAAREKIDAAVKKGDIGYLNGLGSMKWLSEPNVFTRAGQRAVVQSAREQPFAVNFVEDKEGKFVPTEFEKRLCGVTATLTPRVANGKVQVAGLLSLTTFQGFSTYGDSGTGPKVVNPTFRTTESYFFEEMETPDEIKGLMVPGIQIERPADETTTAALATESEGTPERLMFFLSAGKVSAK